MKQIILLKSLGLYLLSQIQCLLLSLLYIIGLYSYNILGSQNTFYKMKAYLSFFRVRLREYYLNSKINANTNTIFLSNHRGISDYFIDSYITGGSSYLGRLGIIYLIPFSSLIGWIQNGIIFFRRGKIKNKDKFESMIKKKVQKYNLIVYPEGTRNLSNHSLSLKYGLIRCAYRQNIYVQIVITKNKEDVWSIKKPSLKTGVTCTVYTSKVFHPKDFEDISKWCDHITTEWMKIWKLAYHPETIHMTTEPIRIPETNIYKDSINYPNVFLVRSILFCLFCFYYMYL